mgnify:FL=1
MTRSTERPALVDSLIEAIGRDEFWPAFQPQLDLRTGEITGFEVLARWGDPEGESTSPAVFIPLLEQQGCLDRLFENLLARACEEAASWPGSFSLAFNVSPLQLDRDDLPQLLAEILPVTGFPLHRVEIELTEGVMPPNDSRAHTKLRKLEALGVNVAIDDFGIEHSNLARLESFPFRKLKLDAHFVRDLDIDPRKREITAAVISLGHALGILVVAEGVETPAEARVLRALGCDLGQGWLYGRPEPARQTRLRLERKLDH